MSQVPDRDMPQHMLDEIFMRQALRQARLAAEAGEVPVGAVIVHGVQVIARATTSARRCTTRRPTRR